MKQKTKKIVIAILASILIIIAMASIIVYAYFFQGNIASIVPEEIKKECNIKEETFQERKVFILTPHEQHKNQKVIFFLHGGSYIAELSELHWNFLKELVKDTDSTLIVPDYPLAPQYQYTDVFNMITPLYQEILKKVESKNIIIMGDSAGGGMSLALVQKLGQEGIEKPSKTILISPWLDVTMQNPEIKPVQEKDKMLNKEALKLAGLSYAGIEEATKEYLVSPIYGPLENLENVIIYTGTNDILNPDVHKLKDLASQKRK